MADLNVTPSNVFAANANTIVANGISGGSIAAGNVVWLDTSVSPNLLKLASGTVQAQAAAIVGIALNSTAGSLEPLSYATNGDVVLGVATLGTVYVLTDGAAPGSLAPGVVSANSYLSIVGLGVNNTTIRLGLNPVAAKR